MKNSVENSSAFSWGAKVETAIVSKTSIEREFVRKHSWHESSNKNCVMKYLPCKFNGRKVGN